MKFRFIISVCDPRQRTHSKIHESCKIPAFCAPERQKLWTQLYILGVRTIDLAKSMQKDMNFQQFQNWTHWHLLSMKKGSSFSFFWTIHTPKHHFKTISLILSKFTTSYSVKCTKWPLCSETTAKQTNLNKTNLKTNSFFRLKSLCN